MPFSSRFSQSCAPDATGRPASSISTALMRVEPNSMPSLALPPSIAARISFTPISITSSCRCGDRANGDGLSFG